MQARFILFFVLFLLGTTGFSQSRLEKAENKKKALQKEIQGLERIFSQTQSKTAASQGKLAVINKKIAVHQEYVQALVEEIGVINEDIAELTDIIIALEGDLDTLKADYAKMIYLEQKLLDSRGKMTYIFAARSYNDLMMRLNYLDQLTEARRSQVEQIQKVKIYLDEKKVKLNDRHQVKEKTLASLEDERKELENQRKEQHKIVSQLKEQAKDQEKKLREKRNEDKKLQSLINHIVEEEMSKEQGRLTKIFEKKKHKLPAPIKKSWFISRKYGKQPHPTLPNVYVNNMGIGMLTEKDAKVYPVHSGRVVTVARISGLNYIVMIQHGEYYTLYANLKNVSVKDKQVVTPMDVVGMVETNAEGETELEFQVWKGKTRMDPEKWLSKKW